uniref:Cadherin domain-containing protein n=1 Tax=Hucho hucho TaxID=62062 RepID=A0A4W5LZK6_9TELE
SSDGTSGTSFRPLALSPPPLIGFISPTVPDVTATDPDKDADQEALRYSLHGQGAESEFIIDEVTGKIYAQRTLNREERAVWRFVVLATDEGGEGLTGFTDIIINVWDINDNAPIFTCAPDCHGNVPENSAPGTSVMEMTATDLDDSAVGQNAVLSYRILGNMGTAGGGSDMFSINPSTGTISVAMSGLDREQAETYLLMVEARDGGGMTGTGTATIRVTDVNDHAPRFTERSCLARVPESSEPNAVVLELSAEDWDTGENAQLTFSVVAGDPEQKFAMVSQRQEQRGTLRLKKRLDYERPSEQRFNLTLKVEDLDFSSFIHCVVEVEDCNDHTPIFIALSQPPAPLPEDVPIGSSVARLTASDSDSGQNKEITYRILQESDPLGQFSVDQSGLVTVTSALDRETAAQHNLVILASDHGSPALTGSATIQLALLDVNDNGPEFEATYAPVVWENISGPQLVRLNQTSTLLRAVDRDSEENGSPFYFSLPLELHHSNDFYLQDNGNGTATITALRAFDRERQKEFLLQIIMSDSGHPPLSTAIMLIMQCQINAVETVHAVTSNQTEPGTFSLSVCASVSSYYSALRRPLVLLLGIFLYTRWRSYKGLKEGVYHVSAHHDGWEDIRENVLNYDEEGGGEEDQDTLSRLGASTAPSSFTTTLRRDVPPTRTPAQGQSRPLLLARKSLSFSSQDLARYLCEIIRDADQAPESAPFDSLQVFSTEGGGSLAGSLSSFSSAGLEEDTARGQDSLKDWGPRFEKLKREVQEGERD